MFQSLRRLLARPAAIGPGLYQFVREAEGRIGRFHLRVDPAGDGLLLADAAAVARLSGLGVVVAKGLLDGDDPSVVVGRTRRFFRSAAVAQIAADVAALKALIDKAGAPEGSSPTLELAASSLLAKESSPERPISADVPLCPPFCTTRILDRLWQLAIPHATIVVPRDPDEAHLFRAVEQATSLGMIAGVRGRGSDLGRHTRIADLAAAGMERLEVYCFSVLDEVHDALAGPGDRKMAVRALSAARKHKLRTAAEMALVRPTLATLQETLEALAVHGVKDLGVFAVAAEDDAGASAGALPAHELAPAARLVEESAERLGLRLFWHPTVQFDAAAPLGDLVCRGPWCSSDAAIRVAPDGSVFPAWGPCRPVGNLFSDDWKTAFPK